MRSARTTETREETNVSDTQTQTEGTGRQRRGFGGVNKLNQTTLRVEDDSVVIAFLEPDNFTYALRHWVKYTDEDGKPVTRVEYCLEDDDCPLCEIGDRGKPTVFFNVVDLSFPAKVLVWEATSDPTAAIQKEFNKLAKRGQNLSDDGLYWVISREKKSNGFYTYSVDKLTEEDMGAEWPKLTPLLPAQREALRARGHGEEYIQLKTRDELQEFVDSLS
jgi:hypothetical protein